MDDEKAAAVGGLMNRVAAQLDAGDLKAQRQPVAEQLVVIAGDVGDFGAVAREAQDQAQHFVVGFVPVPGFAQAPAVDDVAHEIEMVAGRVTQKVDQEIDPAAAGAEMEVGDEHTAVVGPSR